MASLLLFNGDTFQKVQCEELDDYYKSDEDMVQIISAVKIVGDGNRVFPVVEVDY